MSEPLLNVGDDYLTFEQFLADETIPAHSEWVAGKVVPMHAVADQHDAMTGWLRTLLDTYVRDEGLGRVLGDPFLMKLFEGLPARAPDLMFVKAEHESRIERMCLRGPADLAIEIISGASRLVDRLHKFSEYQEGGVPEYWLIDPERHRATFYQLQGGLYVEIEPKAGVYTSPLLPAAKLRVDWLWQTPLPKTLPILRDWGLI